MTRTEAFGRWLASLILSGVVGASVAVTGGPGWAQVGFGSVAYLVLVNAGRVWR